MLINIIVVLMDQIVKLVIYAYLDKLIQQVLNFHVLRYAESLILFLSVTASKI